MRSASRLPRRIKNGVPLFWWIRYHQ